MVQTSGKGVKSIPFRCYENGDTVWYFSNRHRTSQLVYYFAIRVEETERYGSDYAEGRPKYEGTLYVVSPDYAGPGPVRRAVQEYEDMDGARVPDNRDQLTEYMVGHGGLGAPVVEFSSNNKAGVLKKLAKEATVCTGLFGFYLDRRMNGMGATGWDWLRGEFGMGPDKENAKACAECVAAHALAGVDFDVLLAKHRMYDEEPEDFEQDTDKLEYWGKLLMRKWDAELPRSWGGRKS